MVVTTERFLEVAIEKKVGLCACLGFEPTSPEPRSDAPTD